MTAQILRPTISKNKSPQLNSQVRSKFLMRIGVVGTDPNTFCKHQCQAADGTTDSCIPTRDLQKVPRYSTQLKYNRNDERKRMIKRRQQRSAAASADQNSSSSSSATSSSNKSKPKRCITFDESVKVVPIPTRHEYSDRIRSRLWSNAIELYENAARNHVEYAAECYDWRNACDDEQMYLCRSTGEKIHPVHYEMLQDPLLDAHHDASPFKSPTAKTKYWYWESQDII
ncbi:hypothetical protein QTG54_007669 [Skeletonema marinoi]|uniref:Uncharacterized protein n=1 Tax=Skeletonema marinoi TaxID=267567 RepID=A0AAD8YB51_9STRA|nr:hypothetical protein QTG54_007669 [Skeletonema marinoi]